MYTNSWAAAWIAGWQDVPLASKDLAQLVFMIKLHAPINFRHKFHDNKRVTSSPLWGTEHSSSLWKTVTVVLGLFKVMVLHS